MISYPFDTISINGREVSLQSIKDQKAVASSDFEKHTFAFISSWLSGSESFVQFTSGSTGNPKPITISRKQMIASAQMTIEALALKQGYRSLLCLSPEFIAGKMMIVRSFVAGMEIVAVTPSANPLISLPLNQRIDFAAMVPYQIHEIVRSDKANNLERIANVIIGGSAMDRETMAKLEGCRCNVYSTYGMTETISHIALRRLNGPKVPEHYTTLPGITISHDDRGCLIIEWSQLAEKIITNDIVEIASKNSFKWIGRWDNIINTGGFKVVPEEVEQQIEKIFAEFNITTEFFVGSLPDDRLGNKVVLFIQEKLTPLMLSALQEKIEEQIRALERPKEIITGARLIMTENGKINRKSSLNLT